MLNFIVINFISITYIGGIMFQRGHDILIFRFLYCYTHVLCSCVIETHEVVTKWGLSTHLSSHTSRILSTRTSAIQQVNHDAVVDSCRHLSVGVHSQFPGVYLWPLYNEIVTLFHYACSLRGDCVFTIWK